MERYCSSDGADAVTSSTLTSVGGVIAAFKPTAASCWRHTQTEQTLTGLAKTNPLKVSGPYRCQDISAWRCAAWSASTSSVSADRLGTSPLQTPPSLHSAETEIRLAHRFMCLYILIVGYFNNSDVVHSYPDFGDGLLHAFVVDLPQGDRVKLALVEIRHCPVTCLLAQRLRRLESVLEIIPKKQVWQ